jgi:hypothetical protein
MYSKTIGRYKTATTKTAVAPTWTTQVIFDATARQAPRPHFGKGLTRYAAQYTREPYTVQDLEFAMREFNAEPETLWDSETVIDQRAAEAEAQDRLDRGYLPHDLAERLSMRSVVGH